MPALRPLLASGQQLLPPSSSSVSSATGSSHASGHGGVAAVAAPRPVAAIWLSVHKIVDYVVALHPSDTLRALLDAFLLGEPKERDSINQTRYMPLQKRPAPILIETMTTSGVQTARVCS
ncbi:Methyltransferase type 11 [Beauveria brongniartii RCEF 3172]|uniref:Methyltransferase type 11 n=1 Tax=Beauveria brongniartii RCEF 3172 TaxID=1081107 RepID=A0A166XA41_9HYPO|nr:Methyltransferase type 11 [Beauveria brongniartii RCEF 3172]